MLADTCWYRAAALDTHSHSTLCMHAQHPVHLVACAAHGPVLLARSIPASQHPDDRAALGLQSLRAGARIDGGARTGSQLAMKVSLAGAILPLGGCSAEGATWRTGRCLSCRTLRNHSRGSTQTQHGQLPLHAQQSGHMTPVGLGACQEQHTALVPAGGQCLAAQAASRKPAVATGPRGVPHPNAPAVLHAAPTSPVERGQAHLLCPASLAAWEGPAAWVLGCGWRWAMQAATMHAQLAPHRGERPDSPTASCTGTMLGTACVASQTSQLQHQWVMGVDSTSMAQWYSWLPMAWLPMAWLPMACPWHVWPLHQGQAAGQQHVWRALCRQLQAPTAWKAVTTAAAESQRVARLCMWYVLWLAALASSGNPQQQVEACCALGQQVIEALL